MWYERAAENYWAVSREGLSAVRYDKQAAAKRGDRSLERSKNWLQPRPTSTRAVLLARGAIGTETAISVCDQQQTWERGRVVGSVTCVPGTTRKKIPSSTTIAMTPKSPPSGVSTIQQPSGSSSPMVRVHLSINPPLLLLLCVAAGSLGLRTIGFPTCCKPSPLPVSRCLEVVPDVYWYASSSAAPQASKRNRFF